MIALLLLAALPAVAVTVYPPDRSELMAGQAFDFKAEDAAGPVTVCGRPAGELERGLRLEPGTCEVRVGGERAASWEVYPATGQARAKNVILLIADGLSMAHRAAARAMGPGHSQGFANAPLAMDDMPRTALVGTSARDSLLPDSAQTATAYSIGLKTGVEAVGVMADASPSTTDDPRAENLLDLARRRGLSRGIVSTAELYDATPAAFYGHNRRRYEKAAIAAELRAAAPEVALGGGARHLAKTAQALAKDGWTSVKDAAGLAEAAPKADRLIGLFSESHLKGAYERRAGRAPGQPGLVEMLDAALAVLSKDPDGFFLMAEGALVDKYSHDLDWERAVIETIEFDQAVARAKAFAAARGDTLVLVVADHTHGAGLSGVVRDELPGPAMRDKVGTYDWAGWPAYADADRDGYPDRLDVPRRLAFFFSAYPDHYETWGPKLDAPFEPSKKARPGLYVANDAYKDAPGAVLREGNIPRALGDGVHSAEDVILTAMGPGSEAVYGWMENTRVFRLIVEALALGR